MRDRTRIRFFRQSRCANSGFCHVRALPRELAGQVEPLILCGAARAAGCAGCGGISLQKPDVGVVLNREPERVRSTFDLLAVLRREPEQYGRFAFIAAVDVCCGHKADLTG